MSSERTWYYTDRTGAQAGPVSLEDLKNFISQGIVPKSGVAWTEGMENWQIVSQIEALQTTPSPTPTAIASPAPTPVAANPYTPPATQPSNPNIQSFDHEIEYGGIGRLHYFLKILLLVIGFFAIIAIGLAVAIKTPAITAPTPIIMLGIVLIFFVLYIRFGIQRIRNIGWSAWWLLFMIVPLASNILSIALFSCPEGYAQHKKLDTVGIIVASILIILNVISVSANFADLT